MAFTLTSTPTTSPTSRANDRSGGLPHGGDDALIVPRQRVLLHARLAVRDQHHRPAAHLPGHRTGGGAFLGELPGHPFKDALGDCEFVPLGSHFRQLFGQLLFESVQFRAPRGDPFQQFGIQHAPDRGGAPDPSR
ncbi:hypothetical protein AB0M97_27030 [Streptomyces sp. NPDC051207]|uniref:hypothetical protein n=1 Tax=Streptomyces sp. NPDC051207 TaxID=3154641 RepID=UPI0034181640